jgi:hypothetical protein
MWEAAVAILLLDMEKAQCNTMIVSTNRLANITKQNSVSQMRSAGFEPSPVTLHMLMDSFGNGGEPEQLRQCLRD